MTTSKFPVAALIAVAALAWWLGAPSDAPSGSTLAPADAYFAYAASDVSRVQAVGPSSHHMTAERILEWDAVAMRLVSENALPPTKASKYYAALAVAQRDAALLSFAANGKYDGDVAVVSARVTCLFFPLECPKLILSADTDAFSRALADVVMEKLAARLQAEAESALQMEAPAGERYWRGKNAVTPDAGTWTPWLIADVRKFLPPPPPEYGSAEDARQVAAVKSAVAAITPQQRKAVIYWAGGAGTPTPAGIWLGVVDDALRAEKTDDLMRVLDARQAVTTVMADAFIVCWNAKYTYATKRPNARGAGIRPVIPTPNFPSYTSGHSTISAAAAATMARLFPADAERWMRMAEEARDSRLWAGIHYPVDNERGFEIGLAIAKAHEAASGSR